MESQIILQPQCAFMDDGQKVEIKRREGKRGERGGEEMEKVHPETYIYSTFKILILLKTSLMNLPR